MSSIALPPGMRNQLMPAANSGAAAQVDAGERPAAGGLLRSGGGKLYRAIFSNRQLQEELVDFWFNHFNVFLDKGADRFLVPSYERDAIRPHVLGQFPRSAGGHGESPAMLFYLDNWQSVAPGPAFGVPMAKGRSAGLNENYGRELMELHTLGVDGGYTQKDVIEVARCFTGWTIRKPRQGGGFFYNDRVHDKGEKTVLGVNIPAGGGKDDARRCWIFWRGIPRRRDSSRKNWRSDSWPTIRRRRWSIAWRKLFSRPTATSAR